jgi:hypothetical protein
VFSLPAGAVFSGIKFVIYSKIKVLYYMTKKTSDWSVWNEWEQARKEILAIYRVFPICFPAASPS